MLPILIPLPIPLPIFAKLLVLLAAIIFPILLAPLFRLLKVPSEDPDPDPHDGPLVTVGGLGGDARLNPPVAEPKPGVDTDEADGGGCSENEELVRLLLDNWPKFIPPKAFVGGAIEGEVTVDVGVDDQRFACGCGCVAAPQLMPVPVGEVMVEGVGCSG